VKQAYNRNVEISCCCDEQMFLACAAKAFLSFDCPRHGKVTIDKRSIPAPVDAVASQSIPLPRLDECLTDPKG
jgi:hypothetical protein